MKQIRRIGSRSRLRPFSTRKAVGEVELIRNRAQAASSGSQEGIIPADGRPAEEQYQELYKNAPLGFFTLDRLGIIRDVNEMGAKLLGFPVQWLIGRPFVVFVSAPYVRSFLDRLTKSARRPENGSLKLELSSAGLIHPVEISLATDTTGSKVFHRLTVADGTNARTTEKLLQQSIANWYSLVHNAPDTIMTVERSGRISFVNKAVWETPPNTLIGTNIFAYVPKVEHAKVRKALEEAFSRRRRSMCELRGRDALWYQFSFGSPHLVKLKGFGSLTTTTTATTTLLVQEISQHKRAEEELRTSGEELRDFAARLEAVREEERTNLAREVHDELGQALTALKLDLSWVRSKTPMPAEVQNRVSSMIKQVDDTIDRVRRIAADLRPSVLDNLGLVAAIEWHAREFSKRSGIRTRVVSNAETVELSMEVSVAVFRVVQEALTNVVRHAKASRVEVHLDWSAPRLKVAIADNGIGMRKESPNLKSLGIVGMRERISRIGGEFNISSTPRKGTRLVIDISPLS